MSARVHGQPAQRAPTGDRKVVFKSVLDNPFKVSWPHVPLNVQNTALASLVTILAGVVEYHTARHAASRKRKRARHDKARKEKVNAKKKRKVGEEGNGVEVLAEDAEAITEGATVFENVQMDTDADPDGELPPAPPIISHLTFGINEVTKRLESQAHSRRTRISIHAPTTSDSTQEPATKLPHLTYVFVCRADVDPPLLIAHLPELVAACNSPSSSPSPAPVQAHTPVQLVPLPKHAEQTLADAVGLRRVSVLALDSGTPSLATFSSLLSAVQPPSAPWLTAPTHASSTFHIPTHIKQLRTTAPRDMRAAKRARTEGRQAAKQRFQKKQANKDKQCSKDEPKNARGKQKEKKKIRIVASASEDLLPT